MRVEVNGKTLIWERFSRKEHVQGPRSIFMNQLGSSRLSFSLVPTHHDHPCWAWCPVWTRMQHVELHVSHAQLLLLLWFHRDTLIFDHFNGSCPWELVQLWYPLVSKKTLQLADMAIFSPIRTSFGTSVCHAAKVNIARDCKPTNEERSELGGYWAICFKNTQTCCHSYQ